MLFTPLVCEAERERKIVRIRQKKVKFGGDGGI